MSDSLRVKASPGVGTGSDWARKMFDMEIALLPAVLFGAYQFGFGAIKVIVASVLACVLTELVYDVCLKRERGITNGTAIVTGLLLGLTLPADVNLYVPVVGGIFATLVVVLLYGGYGQHFMLPALASRCFLLISFSGQMTTYTIDGVSSATPLVGLIQGGTIPELAPMLIGTINGCIGEVSAIAILIGFAWLLIRKSAKLIAPVVYVAVFAIYLGVFGGHGFDMNYIGAQILGGGFLFTVAFFASDLVVNPKTVAGQVIYGVILGVLTGLYRTMVVSPSITYAVLCANLLIPLIDKFLPGKEKEAA